MSYTPFKFFGKNLRGRDFIVGDIHGSFSALEVLLLRVNFDPEHDRVFSVGDLIDRGPESHRVIEFLNNPWFYSIMGNHERMLLDSMHDTSARDNWIRYNGGNWWKRIPTSVQPRIRQVIEKLPLAFEITTNIGSVAVVHADIPTGMPWSKFVQSLYNDTDVADYALWSRNRFKYLSMSGRTTPVEGVALAVFGHTPVRNPLQSANIYYIDTGASLLEDDSLGKLTMLQVHPTLELHQLDTRHEMPQFKKSA
ncbi:MAG: metallophosphoesterase [Gammaproteobacteria bacterium]|nr:metallophosphoesterase [Gammaproteobacteria bacterium]MBU1724565.1 metallophosphoesterase [Gammaproteobacteria bacterium]MBU2004608.1 metallophosphoesterase [Gammaproteobacteria bacterium]